jgi:hypothetical protein
MRHTTLLIIDDDRKYEVTTFQDGPIFCVKMERQLFFFLRKQLPRKIPDAFVERTVTSLAAMTGPRKILFIFITNNR